MEIDVQSTIEVLNHHRSQGLEQPAIGCMDRRQIRIDPNTIGSPVAIVVDIPRP